MAIDKTKKFADLAYEYIRKKLVKPSKGGITSLPTEKEITNEMLQMFEKLRGAGYNVTNIGKEVRNADDLGFLINRIEQAELDQSKQFLDSAEALETIQFKLNNNIPLNPDDQKKLLGSGFKTASEAFQGFKPKIIEGGKEGSRKESMVKNVAEAMFGPIGKKEGKEGIEQLLKSGDVKKGVAPKTTKETIEKKSMIDPNLTEEENIKNIMKENKAAAKRLEEKMNKEKDLADKLKDYDGDPDAMAEGGIARIGMFAGGKPLRRLLQFLNEQTGRTGSEGLKKLKLSDQMKFFAQKQGFDPDQNRIEYLEQVLEALKADKKLIRSLESDAPSAITGKAKDEMELIADKMFTENFLGDTQKGRFKGMTSKDLDKSILETETMIKNLKTKDRKLNAEGGRIGFEKGGMTRRTFLKLLGGLASIPLVGKFLKPAAKVAKTAEIAKQSGVPAYFPKLVEKIKLLGDDVTPIAATQERQVVTKYKDYEMTEDLSSGAIQIEKTNTGMAVAGDEVYEGIKSKELIEFKPPETIIGKDGKPVKVPAQYEETTARPTNMEGDFEDFDDGLESIDEVLEEVRMKKSGGGLAYMMGE